MDFRTFSWINCTNLLHKLSLCLIIIKHMVLQTSGIGQSYWLLVIIIVIENSHDSKQQWCDGGDLELCSKLKLLNGQARRATKKICIGYLKALSLSHKIQFDRCCKKYSKCKMHIKSSVIFGFSLVSSPLVCISP